MLFYIHEYIISTIKQNFLDLVHHWILTPTVELLQLKQVIQSSFC